MTRLPLFLFFAALLPGPGALRAEQLFESELHNFRAEVVVDQLRHPWSVAFLPDGGLLITERGGRLLRVPPGPPGTARPQPVSGLPPIEEHGQGGLMDVILDPEYAENRRIYLSHAGVEGKRFGTEVLRAVLRGQTLHEVQTIFTMSGKSRSARHFGCRLLFAEDGALFISLGDRAERSRAQDRQDHAGSLIRVHADGSVPKDNPWADGVEGLPEIYTWGNRNIQGMALHPQSGQLYTHEHGPQGGDELNIMYPGTNYGWPEITYGREYLSDFTIGEGVAREDVQPPVHYWIPSIAPSGMSFYTGEEFPAWQGHLFVGSLRFGQLVRLQLEGERVVHEERMLDNSLGRIRDVRQGPDGLLYVLTDDPQGQLVRLRRR